MSLTMEVGRPESASPATAHTELQRQLLACAGLFEVLAEQLGAGGGTDVAGPLGRTLHAERSRAEQAVQGADGECDGQGAPEITVEVSRALQSALDVLEGRPEEEQRLRDWIGALQDASLPLMRSLVARPGLAARLG